METEDRGITYEDGAGYSERTVIVRGDGFAAVVLLDANGKAINNHESFEIDGIENWESVANNDAMLGMQICEAAESVAR